MGSGDGAAIQDKSDGYSQAEESVAAANGVALLPAVAAAAAAVDFFSSMPMNYVR